MRAVPVLPKLQSVKMSDIAISEYLDKRLDRIEDKVDKLFEFKWQIIGGSVVLSTLFSVVTTLLLIFLKLK
jgi:hypothetical protein